VRLEYRPNSELLFYGYVATGERHGGFNWFEARPFKPEEIVAYEAGAKTEWLNRTLIVNGTAFYYDYAEKFVSTVLGNVTTTQNIGDALVMGAELSVRWQPEPEPARERQPGLAGFGNPRRLLHRGQRHSPRQRKRLLPGQPRRATGTAAGRPAATGPMLRRKSI